MTEYEDHDALSLAELVRKGEVTPSELLDAMLERQARENPRLNAVVTPLHEAARAEIAAGLPDGPFRGVPFLVKELVASVKGAPTTSASRLYANNMPTADSEVVARMRRGGLVIAGKTNSP
ncbi:MAG: amidase family protein, partial [Burkholderiaceae bacterium]